VVGFGALQPPVAALLGSPCRPWRSNRHWDRQHAISGLNWRESMKSSLMPQEPVTVFVVRRPSASTVRQAALYLACAVLGWIFTDAIWPSEFSGGMVTGPLLQSQDLSCDLFLVACVATFFVPRIAALLSLLATGLALPFYLYFIFPGLFQRWTGSEYKVLISQSFVWSTLALPIALLALLTAVTSGKGMVTRKLAGPPLPARK